MAISVRRLWERAGRRMGLPANSASATQDFISAVNDTLSDMQTRVGTDEESVDKLADEIDLDSQYEPCIFAGILSVLANTGYKAQSEEVNFYRLYIETAKTAQMYRMKEDDVQGKFGGATEL